MKPVTSALSLLALAAPAFSQNSICFQDANFWIGDTVVDDSIGIDPFGIPAAGQTIEIQVRNAPPGAFVGLFLRAGEDDSIEEPLYAADATLTAIADIDGMVTMQVPIPANMPEGSIFDFQYAALEPVTFTLLKSEVLRTRTLLEPEMQHVGYDMSLSASLIDFDGGDADFRASGGMSLSVVPGAAPDELMGQIGEFYAFADGATLSQGVETGLVQIRLVDTVAFAMEGDEMVSLEQLVDVEVTFPGLLKDPEHPRQDPTFSNDTPEPVTVTGYLTLDYDSQGGHVSFTPFVGAGIDESMPMLVLEGDFDFELEYCQKGKVPKKEVKFKVTIIQPTGGPAPVTQAQIDAQIAKVNDIWCKQCCIKLSQDGPTNVITSDAFSALSPGDAVAVVGNAGLNPPNCPNLFFTGSISTPTGAPANGVTYGRGSNDPTAFISSTANTNTLAHEIGHALGLLDRTTGSNQYIMWGSGNATKRKLAPGDCNRTRVSPTLKNDGTFCKPNPEG